tara:strand:+ start:789 stop:1010 length:222 start_codon:yes stop_codon:yes gene_type:complete
MTEERYNNNCYIVIEKTSWKHSSSSFSHVATTMDCTQANQLAEAKQVAEELTARAEGRTINFEHLVFVQVDNE